MITVTFTKEQYAKLQSLMSTRENQTVEELANRVVERGLYDLAYRTKRNRDQYQMLKEFRASNR
jgi:hypothetical protein